MHRSKLAGFIIDCKTDDLEGAAKFWAAALGMETRTAPEEDGDGYILLVDPEERVTMEVQAVKHDSRGQPAS